MTREIARAGGMVWRHRPGGAGRSLLLAFLVAGLSLAVQAGELKLPHIFGNHMVLQQEKPVPVWGWADPGTKVTVTFAEQTQEATAGNDGRWQVKLTPLSASSTGKNLTITAGAATVTYEDVLVGEVWLCSGQSNMEWIVRNCDNAEKDMAEANFPQIRHIKVPKLTASEPQTDFPGEWQVCAPETAGNFTAAGYFMARKLHQELKVPVGLINSSWGGTRIEPWTPPVGFAGVPSLQNIYKQVMAADPRSAEYKALMTTHLDKTEAWLKTSRERLNAEKLLDAQPAMPAEAAPLANVEKPEQVPTTLYNAMIHPLVGYALRGAIWYQGESNHYEGMLYRDKTQALVEGWRKLWGQGDFPYYYVQIAPFMYGNETPSVLPVFWEAQAAIQSIPHTGMVVINDIGNLTDIHPRNKQDVGDRLARLALVNDYGRKDVVCSGPTFKSLATEGDKLRVTFENTAGGLVSRDGQPLSWFEIIGPDSDFTKAEATIDGDSVVLSAQGVKGPVAVRFAWSKQAVPNLMNKAGLPTGAFRAGQVPVRDFLALRVPEAGDYKLVYDLDLAKLGADIKYEADNSGSIGAFDRVAYFLELQKDGGETEYVFVSMEAFTDQAKQLGIPTATSGVKFQQPVKNMNVASNVAGIQAGVGFDGGNIEFWPHNYAPYNSAKVPGASDGVYDFGDQPSDPVDGYGCMQVHNAKAKQTLLAINNWKAGGGANLGIGNSQGQTRDWTFIGNADSYSVKRLRVLVHPKP